jgi:3-deoxy-D-manno-octulosonic acid kinase
MTVPAGYTALAVGARRALVRDDLVPMLGAWLLTTPLAPPSGGTALDAGRGAAFRFRLDGGDAAVVRFGRRGGVVGRMVRTRYAGVRPRPWREIAVTLAARDRGAPVPEVIAACVHGWGVYRSAVVTAELPGVTTAIAALQAAPGLAARERIARAAGVAVARLHAAGIAHADLNLTNVLVANGTATVVDLDRAALARGSLTAFARRRSLRRLARSARKLDPGGTLVDAAVVRAFRDAYGDEAGRPCGS